MNILSVRIHLAIPLALALLACLSACDATEVASTPVVVVVQAVVVAPPQPLPPSLKEQIAALERSGQLIALDRSDSLLGPDINKNGVRDDIDAYINSLNLTPPQTKAALQKARALQMTLSVDATNKVALLRVGELSMASTNCLFDQVGDIQLASKVGRAIESRTANTKIRVMKYLAYNSARSGSVTTLPDGDTCEK